MPASPSAVIPGHRYRNAPAAIDWLCLVFGFTRHAVYEGENGTIAHAELALGGGMIMLGSLKDDELAASFRSPAELGGVETRSVYLVVADADEVYARAKAVRGERPRGLLLERWHLRSMGRTRVALCAR